MLYVVERVVNEEAQLGNDAQLVSDACTQFVAYGLGIGIDVVDDLFAPFGGEDAQISGADAQVGTDACACHRHHDASHHACLALEDEAKLFLQQSCYTVLSCLLHINSLSIGSICKGTNKKGFFRETSVRFIHY